MQQYTLCCSATMTKITYVVMMQRRTTTFESAYIVAELICDWLAGHADVIVDLMLRVGGFV